MATMQQIEKICREAAQGYAKAKEAPHIENYCRTGDAKELAKVSQKKGVTWWTVGLMRLLTTPPDWTDQDRRLIHVLTCTDETEDHYRRGFWWRFHEQLDAEPQDADYLSAWRAELLEAGMSADTVDAKVLSEGAFVSSDGRVNSAGRYMLSLPPKKLVALVKGMSPKRDPQAVVRLLVAAAPALLPELADALLRHAAGPHGGHDETPALLLASDGRFADNVLAAMQSHGLSLFKFRLGRMLYAHDPKRFGQAAFETAERAVVVFNRNHSLPKDDVAEWMAEHMGKAAVPAMAASMQDTTKSYPATRTLNAAASLGSAGVPVMIAALDAMTHVEMPEKKARWYDPAVSAAQRRYELRLAALKHLAEIGKREHDERIYAELERSFASVDADTLPKFITFAGGWDADRTRPMLWPLMKHKGKLVRSAAARALGQAGDPAVVEQAGAMLAEKKADTRAAAVTLLSTNGGEKALELLENHLDAEASDDVRDLALLGLADAWKRQGRTLTKADVRKRIKKAEAAGKLASSPADWLDVVKLPPPKWDDGEALTDVEKTYLLYRQSRAKEIRADVEAEPMYALLDRGTAGDFAEGVLSAYLAGKQDAKDRWALAVAGLLGDDGVVPLLSRQVREWVDGNRGKLAEYAVQALALVGSDVALQAVDGFGLKYRSKMKNVGRAAVEAFDAAATAAGVTPEELGDKVVPLLGFPADGSPRVLPCGDAEFQAGIGPDLKLRYLNLAKNKPAKSLPKSCGGDVLAEMKDVAANLKDVVKNQTNRLENLLVRQRRWPAARWRELFLQHPVLRPFAWRLVWGNFDDGRLLKTFRPLEDGTLTDTDDEAVDVPTSGEVGMVHPLELDEQATRAWREHLNDYEVTPPFGQMERPVVSVDDAAKPARRYDGVEGTDLNAMTFRSRTEKLGWRRGSVNDGGSVFSFIKTFPAAGVDCLLSIDGYFMGVGADDTVKLEAARFARHGSYATGSYSYDEPAEDKDERVVPLGDVPPIAYSEAIADLHAIAGKGEGEGEREPKKNDE